MRYCRALFALVASLGLGPLACGSGQGGGPPGPVADQSSSSSASAPANGSGNIASGGSSATTASVGSASGSVSVGGSSGSVASGGGSSGADIGAMGDAGSSGAVGAGPGDDAGPSVNDASVAGDTGLGVSPSDAATSPRDGAGTLPKTTLFVAGDSTVSPYGTASAQQGWGEHLIDYFDGAVTVDDEAIAGRSVKTFMYNDAAETQIAAHWQAIRSGLRPGDYVMVEFGINDSSAGSPRFVAIPDFTRLLGIMVDTILSKQATPILVTPSALQYWVNGVETNAREQPYADAMKQVASQKHILVDDLNALSVAYLNMIGQTAAAQIYINGDKAHFTLMGAREMAKLVTQELVTIGSPLGGYVR